MKITKIDVFMKKGNVASSEIGCRVYTDEAIYGDGEGAIAYGTGSTATFGMICDLAPLIIGMDPLDNEVIWDKLYKETFWGQNGGPVVFAGISALDMALWDIKGKYFNVPVYKLLGGKKRDNLRTYASQLQSGWTDKGRIPLGKPEEYAEVAKRAVAEGYDCVKYDFFTYDRDCRFIQKEEMTRLLSPYYINLVEERVAAVREAVGPSVDIIIENHSNLDANSAVQLGTAVQKHNIFYYEEPNTPNPKTTRYIRDCLAMPIAHGERLYARWQFVPYFENQSVQVIQPDIGNTGGLTEAKKICDMAYAYDVCVQPHICAGPLSTAAALHLEAAIPNFVIHEHHYRCLPKTHRELCIYDYQPENGKYKVPELPGLGNEWAPFIFKEWNVVTIQ